MGSLAIQGHFHRRPHTWRDELDMEVLRRRGLPSIVYADSLTAVSADSFKFSSGTSYPRAVADF